MTVTAILIAGPTASGKSALAMKLAAERGGVIVNADSMQVYAELSILTARPGARDLAAVPHRLYGHVPAREAYSVGRYIEDVRRTLAEIKAAGQVAVIVGGTGLYFKALTEGLSPIPPVAPDVRAHWRAEGARLGAGGLHGVLAERDPVMSARLGPHDAQRLVRALEVLDATGRSLAEWQALPGVPVVDIAMAQRFVVAPPREIVLARAEARLQAMMAEGALDEVAALMHQGLPRDLPAMRALGVAALSEHLAGRCSLEAAVADTLQETRQYIKRQMTWLCRYMIAWNWMSKT